MGFGGQRHNKKPIKMIYNSMDKSVLTYGAGVYMAMTGGELTELRWLD